jgi:hypothetical protein
VQAKPLPPPWDILEIYRILVILKLTELLERKFVSKLNPSWGKILAAPMATTASFHILFNSLSL